MAPTVMERPKSANETLREPGDRLGPALLGAAYCALLAAPGAAGYGHGLKFVAAAAILFVASMFAGGRKRIAEAAREYELERRHLR